MDIKFIRDDAAIEREKVFSEVISLVKKNVAKEREQDVAKRFLFELCKAAKKIKQEKVTKSEEGINEDIRLGPEVQLAIQEKWKTALEDSQKQVQVRSPEKTNEHEKVDEIKKVHSPIPERTPVQDEVEKDYPKTYPLIVTDHKVMATATIYKDPNTQKLVYSVAEPFANEAIIKRVKKDIGKKYKKEKTIIANDEFIEEKVEKAAKKEKVDYRIAMVEPIKYYLFRDFTGLGVIEPLLHDKGVSQVKCEGTAKPIKVVHKAEGELETTISFKDKKDLDWFVDFLAELTQTKILKGQTTIQANWNNLKIEANKGKEVDSRFIITKLP